MWHDYGVMEYPNNHIEKILCPLLIIRGDNDPLLRLNDIVELMGLVKNSFFLNIPFAGHAAFNGQEEIIKIALNRFFRI
jgi:hypothetical protein